MRRAWVFASAALAGFFVLAVAASSADTFEVRLVSQTSSTVTLGWDPQPGYGYLFSADGQLVSRTNDPDRSTVKFSKSFSSYEVAVIVKGATGTYPPPAPPPPKAACENGLDDDGDGKVDLADPGCSSSSDTDETDPPPPPPAAKCANGTDDDGDGKIDLADPGCSSSADDDETDSAPPPPPTGYPDASNTGVPAGTTLTAYSGPLSIRTNGTVIDGKTINGSLSIEATGVIIRRSRINGTVSVDDRLTTQTAVTIEDSEIICPGGGTGVSEADFTVRRVEITKCENGFDINQNVLIEDSFIHDLTIGGHEDGAQLSFGHWNGSSYPCCALNVTFRHNTIYGASDAGQFGTSAIISNSGGDVNILIENNLMAGGAFTLYCEQNARGTNYVVKDNHFSTRFGPKVGAFGPSTECADETQSGNVIHETGQAITLG